MAVAEELTPLYVNKTPSGITIEFFSDPRHYRIDGVTVPSVTEILDALFKDLSWWGQETGVRGIEELWRKGLLNRAHPSGELAIMHPTENVWTLATFDLLIEQLKLQKLTTSYVVGRASDRGQAAHDALEAWAVTREIPSAENYPPDQQAYIRAVRSFCEHCDEVFLADAIEIVVGSAKHAFAGRYDVRGRFLRDITLDGFSVRKDGSAPLQPQNRQKVEIAEGTSVMLDLKTSKGVYPSHLLQLAGYEGAGQECGYSETDRRFVLHATMHGVYELVEAKATYEQFLVVRRTWEVLQACKEALARG